MITRLVPLFPYNLQNFAYGVTDMPLKTYAVGTFLFMLPGTAMYTFGTAGLADPSIRKACFLGAAILAVAVTTAGVLLKKKVLAEQEKTDLKMEMRCDERVGHRLYPLRRMHRKL